MKQLRTVTGRNRAILLSIITSSGSKIVGVVAQFIAYPVAVQALGVGTFGAYVMLSSVLAWVSISSVGIGPALTRAISMANGAGRRDDEAEAFGTAMWLALGIATLLVGSVIGLLGMGIVRPAALLGTTAGGPDALSAIVVTGGLVALSVVTSVTEGARAGYLEQYVTNMWNACASAMTLGALLLVAWQIPTLTAMCVAVNGTIAVAKVANTITLIGGGRRYLLPVPEHFRWRTASKLTNSSVSFTIVQLSSLMVVQGPTLIVGWNLGAKVAAPLGVVLNLEALLATGLVMITTPLWPAVTDAHVRSDHAWIRKARRKLVMFTLLYSISVGAVICLFGDQILHFWLGGKIDLDPAIQIIMGVLFPLWMLNHCFNTLLIGLGRLWQAAGCLAAWAVAAAVAGLGLVRIYGASGMAGALCAGAAISLPALWLLTNRAMGEAIRPNSEGGTTRATQEIT